MVFENVATQQPAPVKDHFSPSNEMMNMAMSPASPGSNIVHNQDLMNTSSDNDVSHEQMSDQDHSPAQIPPRLTENDFHTLNIENETFRLPKKYQIKKIIGQGSYGLVCAGKNSVTGEKVAIKKNKDIFQRGSDRNKKPSRTGQKDKDTAPYRSLLSQKRILRELKILKHLQHPNIIRLIEVIPPESFDAFGDVVFVSDLMEADLRDILNSNQPLTDQHVQYCKLHSFYEF
jgi:mitogen-activated protein kinase 1/3